MIQKCVKSDTCEFYPLCGWKENDNGLWLVTNVPGAPDWHGRDICLQKIGKSGKLNTSKGRYGFWPIGVFTNDRMKRLEANAWNAEHATIEVLDNSAIKTWAEVKAFFEQLADGNRKYADMPRCVTAGASPR